MLHLLLASALLAPGPTNTKVSMTAIPEGAAKMIGFYRPEHLQLAEGVGKLRNPPANLHAPLSGTINLQGKSFGVIVDRTEAGDLNLYVDTKGDGNFAPASWTSRQYSYTPEGPKLNMHSGTAKVSIKVAGVVQPVSLGVYMFDKDDPKRSQLKNQLLYYADFAEKGTATFGKKRFPFILSDPSADASSPSSQGAQLFFDRKGNGKFGAPENTVAPDKPFNIDGDSRKISSLSFADGAISFAPSSVKVAEVPLPLSLLKGDAAIPFLATTMDNKSVTFPTSYKRHLVLLDFWATWCGPCMQEVPNVVASYNKYHSKGFDILGISLDNPDTAKNIGEVTKDKGMSWPQVCDQKFWEARVAKLYYVQSIPQAFLVDGDTGKILAQGDELRGEGLSKALEAHLRTLGTEAKK